MDLVSACQCLIALFVGWEVKGYFSRKREALLRKDLEKQDEQLSKANLHMERVKVLLKDRRII